ncbi:MAG: hypothetical protein N2Z22_11915 [Turneriella sp.]|nr:hypothetical protein [Turneriella sp.]
MARGPRKRPEKAEEDSARSELLRRALEAQLAQTAAAGQPHPIESLMDRLQAAKNTDPAEYAALSAEIARIQERNKAHLAKLESLLNL